MAHPKPIHFARRSKSREAADSFRVRYDGDDATHHETPAGFHPKIAE